MFVSVLGELSQTAQWELLIRQKDFQSRTEMLVLSAKESKTPL